MSKKENKTIKEKVLKKLLLFLGSMVLTILLINAVVKRVSGVGIGNLLAGNYNREIPSVEIQSDDYNQPASWHITKSAKWTGNGKAKVTFDLDTIPKTKSSNYDVLFVLDVSGSMYGDKINKLKSDSRELVEAIMSNGSNKVAIVTFTTDSEIVLPFTTNKAEVLSKIDALTHHDMTNYNAGYKNALEVMKNYQKQDGREVIMLFLTDGEPNTDVHNQIGTYETLKDKYPYMTINGVQYEMGAEVKESIKKITDDQFIAYTTNLDNVLFEASVNPTKYENFIVTDYIEDEYFYVKSVDDIKVARGTVELTEENGLQKIVWNIGVQPTGFSSKMEINLTLKDKDYGNTEYFPTNEKETIETKIPDENKKTINSNKTPVLKSSYKVIYDSNPPTGCERETSEEKHTPYSNVRVKEEPTCNGYNFKGWEIVTEDVEIVNGNVFQMPEKDVHIKGTWGKPSIVKRMDGTVHTAACEGGILTDDPYESGRQIYQGSDPCNYIKLGNDMYRIIAIEADGTYKVIKNESIGNIVFDPGRATVIEGVTTSGSTVGTRYNSSGYCYDSNYGCKIWGSKTTTLDSNGNNVTTMPQQIGGTEHELPDDEAYLNVYLNGGTYVGVNIDGWINTLPINIKSKVQTHTFNVGLLDLNNNTFEEDIEQEASYKWNGKVGLITPVDYVKANSNTEQCSSIKLNNSNYETCTNTDWLFNSAGQWTLPPYSFSRAFFVWNVGTSGYLGGGRASSTHGSVSTNVVRPVLYLSSNIQLSGTGTSDSPFTIGN